MPPRGHRPVFVVPHPSRLFRFFGVDALFCGAGWLLACAELTGISPEVLSDNNARVFREVWQDFASWLSEISVEEEAEGRSNGGVVLVAHNAKFDHKFLAAEQSRGGFDK